MIEKEGGKDLTYFLIQKIDLFLYKKKVVYYDIENYFLLFIYHCDFTTLS